MAILTFKQLAGFLSDNEKGEFVNSADGVVRVFILTAQATNAIDLAAPMTTQVLSNFLTPDRMSELSAWASSLAPYDPVGSLVAVGFTSAQANAIVAAIDA